jgi:hypothetical protein
MHSCNGNIQYRFVTVSANICFNCLRPLYLTQSSRKKGAVRGKYVPKQKTLELFQNHHLIIPHDARICKIKCNSVLIELLFF